MMGHVVARSRMIRFRSSYSIHHPVVFADGVRCPSLKVSKTLKMESQAKRSTCPSCSKPSQLCLCKRMHSPCLDNQVSVTILQHSIERKHALNSARIARLGLRNFSMATVFDVDDEAEFVIRVIRPGHQSAATSQDSLKQLTRQSCSENGVNCSGSDDGIVNEAAMEAGGRCVDAISELGRSNVDNLESGHRIAESVKFSQHFNGTSEETRSEQLIRISMRKQGVITNVSHSLMLETGTEDPSFERILASPAAMDVLAKGFIVTKYSKGEQEFELEVPPGSALLFPSEESMKITDLKEKGLKLKNLIVLDGTWGKAKRMYLENPWLKLLCCHVKLDIEGTSLYREVRRQPRVGCLSTIESIVYAMKEIGDYPDGLDNMLDVFESMVEDQRRFKDENLQTKISEKTNDFAAQSCKLKHEDS